MLRRNSGFILVSVLLTVTLLLTSATAFAWFASIEAKKAAAREDIFKFRNVAEIAVKLLCREISEDSNGYDSFTEKLYDPDRSIIIKIGNYDVSARIRPLNDKISVNGLFLPDGVTLRSEYETAWNRAWEEIGLPQMAAQTIDFMDKDSDQRLGGAERDTNINRVVSDLSELRAVPDIDDGVLWGVKDKHEGLAKYITVPGGQRVNINVAGPEVIAILDEGLTASHARSLTDYRSLNPITSIDDLKRVPGFPEQMATKLANVIGFESTHFLLSMEVRDENGRLRNYRVIVERGASGPFSWEE